MSGAQYSGSKVGIPPGPMGPAFRTPLMGRALDLPARYPGDGGDYEDYPEGLVPGFPQAKSIVTDPWAPPPVRIPAVVYNADAFLSALPPQGLTLFHRMWTFEGTTVLSAGVSALRALFTLDPGQSLILTSLIQNWYQSANSALEPDALEPFPEYWNINGNISFELVLDNSAVFNAQESLFDPAGGAGATRSAPGFTRLGVNLLDYGLHSTAAYLLEGDVQARWNYNSAPAVVPTSMGVEVRGFLAPTKTVYETIIDVRRRARLGP